MIELNNSAKHSGGVGRGAASPRDRTEQERRRTPGSAKQRRGGWGGGAQLRQTEAGGLGGMQLGSVPHRHDDAEAHEEEVDGDDPDAGKIQEQMLKEVK